MKTFEGLRWCFLLLTALMMQQTTTVAQDDPIDIRGTIRFTSTRTSTVYTLDYGVGSNYTDSTDRQYEDQFPPFQPPGGSYLIYWERDCTEEDGPPPCYWMQDLRGIPDSVANGEVTQFKIQYRLGLLNSTGAGFGLSILNPDWPALVDSIHIVDPALPAAFNKTFTGPVSTTIEDEFTSHLDVTVYYNLTPSSVENVLSATSQELQLWPNQITDGSNITIRANLNRGSFLAVVGVDGVEYQKTYIRNSVTSTEILTGGLPSGNYYLAWVGADGRVQAFRPFRVIR